MEEGREGKREEGGRETRGEYLLIPPPTFCFFYFAFYSILIIEGERLI